MIVVMKPSATEENIVNVQKHIESMGLATHLSKGSDVTIIGVIGDKHKIAVLQMNSYEGVEKTVRVTEKYKLVSREFQSERSVIDVRGVKIGGRELAIMAGPCSVECEPQLMEAAKAVKAAGAQFLRGGAFKPRTSPYDFQGLGEEGLKLLAMAAKEYDLRVVTEIVDIADLEVICKYADVLQIDRKSVV